MNRTKTLTGAWEVLDVPTLSMLRTNGMQGALVLLVLWGVTWWRSCGPARFGGVKEEWGVVWIA